MFCLQEISYFNEVNLFLLLSKRMSHIKKPLKQMAGIPIKSFNPKYIESDLDTIRSELVRDKIKETTTHGYSNRGI